MQIICMSAFFFVPLRPFLKRKRIMKRFFAFIAAFCFAVSAIAETEFTFTKSADMNQTKDGITVVIANGGGNAPSMTSDHETGKPEMRLYVKNTITVSSSTALTNIQLVFAKSSASNKAYAGLNATPGTLTDGGTSTAKNDWKVDAWTGSATSVVFTLTGSGQRQIRQIVIDGEPVVIEPEEDKLPTEDDLDWTYEYNEPEIVLPKDTQIFGKEYAFINNNILVHCSEGSIVKENTEEGKEEDAYFGCRENQTLTFAATQYIKGIAIKGTVRKEFSATASRGDISYCTDPDQETTSDPVLVVRNVDALSVTINCNKNLSCYEVKVYFEENPEIACEEIDVPGETFFLNYDTASIELDTDESTTGQYVYSLYIWDKTNDYIYLTLDIHVPEEGKFVGMYDIENGNMTTESFFQYGENYEDYSYATEGQMVISKTNGLYSISGYITCENKNTYNFTYTGVIDGGLDDDAQGLHDVNDANSATKILRDGQLFILRGENTYTATGAKINH